MRTGEGEDGGLRAAPIVPDEAVDALPNPPDGYADGRASDTAGADSPGSADSPGNSVTQQLPMVRREGLGEPPSVRAVARRVASALPALGRDEIIDAPRSARTTAFRRRRAAAEGRAVPADASPAATSDPAVTGHAPGHPYPGESVVDVVERLSPVEPAPAATGIPNQADRGEDLEPIATVERADAHGMPVSRGGEVTATQLMGQPAALPDADVLDAEILDNLPSYRSSVDAAAAEVPTALTTVAFREARTDQWIMGQPEPAREPSAVLDPIRPGPAQLESDSWDTGSLPAIKRDAYQGRRRAATAGARLWVVIGLVVTALSAAIAIPFLMNSGPSAPADARTPDGQVSMIDITSPGSDPATSPGPAPAVGASPLITASSTSTSPPAASPPPFLLAIEASDVSKTVLGWPAIRLVSNGLTVIDKVGDWPNTNKDGWVEFSNIMVPTTDSYAVTIYFVYSIQNPNPATRQIVYRANDGTTWTGEPTFSPASAPTARRLYQNLQLQAGTPNKIRFWHNSAAAPAIARIEITKA